MAKQAELQLAKKKGTESKVLLSGFRQMGSRLQDLMHVTRLVRLNSLGAGGGCEELRRKNDGDTDRLAQGQKLRNFGLSLDFQGGEPIFVPIHVTISLWVLRKLKEILN